MKEEKILLCSMKYLQESDQAPIEEIGWDTGDGYMLPLCVEVCAENPITEADEYDDLSTPVQEIIRQAVHLDYQWLRFCETEPFDWMPIGGYGAVKIFRPEIERTVVVNAAILREEDRGVLNSLALVTGDGWWLSIHGVGEGLLSPAVTDVVNAAQKLDCRRVYFTNLQRNLPEVERTLVLSSAHIHPDDRGWMVESALATGHGWRLPLEVLADDEALWMAGLSLNVRKIIKSAQALGCTWISFDQDAAVFPEFANYGEQWGGEK